MQRAENLKVAPILSIIKLLSECNTVNETTSYSHNDAIVI